MEINESLERIKVLERALELLATRLVTTAEDMCIPWIIKQHIDLSKKELEIE